MKLFDAIHKSTGNAAVYYSQVHNWAWVVVAWPNSEYSIETHAYKSDGDTKYVIANFEKFSLKVLQIRLGKDTYASTKWEPYNYTILQNQNYGRVKSKSLSRSNGIRRKTKNRTGNSGSDIYGKEFESLFGITF